MPDAPVIREVLRRWDIDGAEIFPHVSVQGSPERSLYRTVVETIDGHRFVLEQLDGAVFDKKSAIARTIDYLFHRGLTVCPYCKGNNGQWVQHHCGTCWQLAPLLEGVPLDRETYWMEGWRGEAAARFLGDLATATRDWTVETDEVFSVRRYIDALMSSIGAHAPELLPRIAPVAAFLRRHLYPVLEGTPLGFCHGDPHPINTIWGKDRILAVIDWEFCGWKPLLYDAALVVGCVGAEAPGAKNGAFISEFLKILRNLDLFSADLWARLPLLVLAVRFGWLSEWLRRNDSDMVDFELFYMGLLMDDCSSSAQNVG
jgi:homoserine kinase type II